MLTSETIAGAPAAATEELKPSILHRMRRAADLSGWDSAQLIRAELFSAERLEQHAESLAAAQPVTTRTLSARALNPRLRDNGRVLFAAHRAIARAIAEGRAITPAAEWLVDNYHVVEAQIRQIGEDLPPGYYRQLPKLADGPLAGYPRVFGVAWAFVAHTDSRFDAQLLCRFVGAYQRVQPLEIGELWAVAITLRIVLVENLRRAAELIALRRADRQQADGLADRVLGLHVSTVEPLAAVLAEWDRKRLSTAFAVQLLHRLRDQDPRIAPALTWLDERLLAQGKTADAIVRDEHQRQAASNVTVRNIIMSMRSISAVDWADLVESVSLVDAVLRAGSDFARMDFPTRDRYRQAIEELARGSRHSEPEIARRAVFTANQGSTARERDPGYALFAAGRAAFETALGYRPALSTWIRRVGTWGGIGGYIAGLSVLAAALVAVPLLALAREGHSDGMLLLLALVGFAPAFDAAMALVNASVTSRFGARILPALELRDGIPEALRTLVVVPTLLTTQQTLAEHLQRLETHHLASPDGDLYFALLSDWTDAAEESVPGDGALLDAAVAGIARLNERHGPGVAGARFLLLHRRRRWNPVDRLWMGWERKRGKLHELNRLLRGARDTSFVTAGGAAPGVPARVRYIVTLDADTRLPRDSVRRLVGKMAHPLNQPRFDAARGRVVEGYAVLQPRVAASLPVGREGSMYQRLFSGAGGIDPYSAAVSDVYQDLCGEGSYVGKGIYDIDAFDAALADRIPESVLLSHDLLEGMLARAGLVSDVEVVEDYPSRYDVAAARAHRWARGDWQLLPWLFGRADARKDHPRRGIPLIGRWKMIDNLRRTLLAPSCVVGLIIGWTLPLHAAAIWTAFIMAALAIPALPPVLGGIMPRHSGISKRAHARSVVADLRRAVSQWALLAGFLAHQAWLMGDAIVRTLWRLALTHRLLLQWLTAAQAQISPRLGLGGFYRQMAGAVAIGVAVIALAAAGQLRGALAVPFALVWILSPVIARWVSRSPRAPRRLLVNATDTLALRLIARRAWRYFDSFVTPADHLLPPDNFQEDPQAVLAHRTSPTNIGLYLLSILNAQDFGWIGVLDMLERLEGTLGQIEGLEHFRGHLYNWYDTQDLRPLEPKYISSVDSGNLAAHLITLANGCGELMVRRDAGAALHAGLNDALALARESMAELGDNGAAHSPGQVELERQLEAIAAALGEVPVTPAKLAANLQSLSPLTASTAATALALSQERADAVSLELSAWVQALHACLESHRRDVPAPHAGDPPGIEARLAAIAAQCRRMARAVRFDFLFDPDRKLLSIGFRVAEGALDPSCYDLLASEARLASFVAIANDDLPARHWFRLGRALTPVHCGAALVSWSGSMFEYLMPSLVMRAPAGSLLEQTSQLIVWRQQNYARELHIPWGISESAYNARDLDLTYQYSSFGVPGLGLKRGLGESIVVAPYATALAAMVEPKAAALNFARLARAGALGRYGYYESLDYTPRRLPTGRTVAIVHAYMAHHQGMTIVAIANTLLRGVMRARFHSEPRVQATELLLQERTPRDVAVAYVRAAETRTAATRDELPPAISRSIDSPHDATPRTRLLSNGRYAVMLTGAGSGYSRWQDLAVTRWREDVTCDAWGSYIFLRDLDSGHLWSAAYQPTCIEPSSYEVTFNEDHVRCVRRDGDITTTLELYVSAESDAEVRRVSILNTGHLVREIELTSYAELVLAPSAADTAHPTFSKMFVQTEFVAEPGVILATRRRRSAEEPEVWAAHQAVLEGEACGELQLETDRARFLGRARELRAAAALTRDEPLSGTVGTVLDPIFSLRQCVRLAPGATARVAFWTMIAPSRADVLDLADKHHDPAAFDRVTTLAWTQAQVELHHLAVTADEANLFQLLAGYILYSDRRLRASSGVLRRAIAGPAALWAHGISGDLPIVLVRIDDTDDLDFARQLLRAFEYWRMKQLTVDLVILNERAPSYTQDLQAALEVLIRTRLSRPRAPGAAAQGDVFVLRADIISSATRDTLLTAARVVLLSRRGSLVEQLEQLEKTTPRLLPSHGGAIERAPAEAPLVTPALEFFNGFGGFGAEGREYVTILRDGECTPAPWINVIANPDFGFQVSAEGAGYSWAGNSRDHQLTPWSNDPSGDRPGEVLYVRDEDSGAIWGPTASPVRHPRATYIARHGQGYSQFEHTERGIALELLQFVALDAPIKVSRLRIRNLTQRSRRLSVTAYVEWVLGASRGASAPYLCTELDGVTRALLARNLWMGPGCPVAFVDMGGRQSSWTGDRREFLGRNGTLARPAALSGRSALSGRVGGGLDPCAALRTSFELAAGATLDIVTLLGEAATAPEAQALIQRWRGADLEASLQAVQAHWRGLLETVVVKTPDRALDLMLNGWLLYQTIACRVLARSAFYQASGAYGFRDQLQDTMALVTAQPALTRAHLLRAAGRQFLEGDVQHWWLPQSGRGVRTRVSDDRAWLCYCVAHYVEVSGDLAVLDESVAFLEGAVLREDESERFFDPTAAEASATLFEHCALALDQSLRLGSHNLPLMGTGDWNDGMNRVGAAGRGESIWLGWFLHSALMKFVPLASSRGEIARGESWRSHAVALREALEREGWDGEWYRRGYYDDGTPLGSAGSSECRIDSIAQSWGVISAAADPERARRAMAAVDTKLVQREAGLVLLFAPPFDRSAADPGYIKGYPPGVRENGGQYTHAAVWSVIAFALLRDADKAAALYALLNPIHHARTHADALIYKVEPYVVAADVYAEPPHVGRGGWTWYTGSAAWLYRAGLEWLLGCRLQGASLLLDPCVPRDWQGFQISLRYHSTRYEIAVEGTVESRVESRVESAGPSAAASTAGVTRRITSLELDGVALSAPPARVPLVDDGATHQVRAILG
jgi:cyclic beta-1,2-glucan synthetase